MPGTANDITGAEQGVQATGAVVAPAPAFGATAFVSDERFGDGVWETILTFPGTNVVIDGHPQSTLWRISVQMGGRVRRSFRLSLRVAENAARFVRR